MTTKQILQSAKSALQSAGISNVQAGRNMEVTHQRVSALLSGEDCTLSTLIKLLETSGVYDSVMYPEPRKILAEVLNNTPARRAVADKLVKEMRYVSNNLISREIMLSKFVELCEAAGCSGNVFKI